MPVIHCSALWKKSLPEPLIVVCPPEPSGTVTEYFGAADGASVFAGFAVPDAPPSISFSAGFPGVCSVFLREYAFCGINTPTGMSAENPSLRFGKPVLGSVLYSSSRSLFVFRLPAKNCFIIILSSFHA